MARYGRFFGTLGLLCALASPAAFAAEPPSIGVTLNGLLGSYNTGQGATTLPLVPLPIFEAHVPLGRLSIDAEGLPPIGPISYDDGRGATQATRIGYASAEVHYAFRGDRYAIGMGETLITQATTFPTLFVRRMSSRVAGFRFSGRIRLQSNRAGHTDLEIGASPRMHAVQRSVAAVSVCGPQGCVPRYFGFNDPEVASLADVKLTHERPLGRYGLLYGIRYFNYVAHYPAAPRQLADHDRFVMPFVGITAKLGP
jgi:hypothetical protein